jgi:hypothetical protein
VKQDVLEIQVAVVTVRVPAAGAQINFHVAGTRRAVADLNDCAPKIRPAFDAGKTGMQNANGFSIRSFELVAAQALMPPNGLEQTLGWHIVCIAQKICRAGRLSPNGVKIFSGRRHLEIAFARTRGQSQVGM